MGISIKSVGVSMLLLAMAALAVPSGTARADDAVIQSCYNVRSEGPGITTLNLQLLVSTQTKQIHGMATLIPTGAHVPVTGMYMQEGKEVVATVHGGSPQATIVMSRLMLPQGWGKPGQGLGVVVVHEQDPAQFVGPAVPCSP